MSRIAIHLNRLADALKAHGAEFKRTQILEIAAKAFGYRNSNEATAAAKAGDLDPPHAKALGRLTIAGHDLIAFEDPTSRTPFAAPAKKGDILIAPLGGLISVPALSSELPILGTPLAFGPTTKIFTLCSCSEEGEIEDLLIATTKDELHKEFANRLRERDADLEKAEQNGELESDETNSDLAFINAYFEVHSGQWQNNEISLPGPQQTPAKSTKTLYVFTYCNKDGIGAPIFGWTQEDVRKKTADDLRSHDKELVEEHINLGFSTQPDADQYFIEAYASKYDGAWELHEIPVPLQTILPENVEFKKFITHVSTLPIDDEPDESGPNGEEVSYVLDGDTAHDTLKLLIQEARSILDGASPRWKPTDKKLKSYRVTLRENAGDKFTIRFDCMAEDGNHAEEQAKDAYPACDIVHCFELEPVETGKRKAELDGIPATAMLATINADGNICTYLAADDSCLYMQVANWCRSNWMQAANPGDVDLDQDNNRYIVQAFFDDHETHSLKISELNLGQLATSKKASRAVPKPGAKIKRHVGMITYDGGSVAFTALNESDLDLQIAEWCREHWTDAANPKEIDDPETANDRDVIETYFEGHTKETLEIQQADDICDQPIGESPLEATTTAQLHPNLATRFKSQSEPAEIIQNLASQLEDAANDDIYYDAASYGEDAKQDRIDESRAAIAQAAEFLRNLAKTKSKREKPLATIHVGTIEHRHGEDMLVAGSKTGLRGQIADYCRMWWGENANEKIAKLDADQMNDEDVLDLYEVKNECGEPVEFFNTNEFSVDLSETDPQGPPKFEMVRTPKDLNNPEDLPLSEIEWRFSEAGLAQSGDFILHHGWVGRLDDRPYLAPAITRPDLTPAEQQALLTRLKAALDAARIENVTETRLITNGPVTRLHLLAPFSGAFACYTPKKWQEKFNARIKGHLQA